jgi:hypothetical protein
MSILKFRETVSRDFQPLFFVHQTKQFIPLAHDLKYFQTSLRIRRLVTLTLYFRMSQSKLFIAFQLPFSVCRSYKYQTYRYI